MSLTIAYPTRTPKGDKFKKHIKDSSGVKDVELLEYHNPDNKPLTEIYNQALTDASNDVVVLIHDDLFFNKNGWGKNVLKHFEQTDFGILGVAGTTHLPASGKWWEDTTKMVGVVKHSHEDENGQKRSWESKYSNNFGDRIIETTILDGLFLAVHRDRIVEKFDEEIKGTHFYDIDFTFKNHLKGVKVGVMFDVKLTHKSIGETDDKWEENRKQFVEKYAFHPDTGDPLLPYHIDGELIYDEKEVHIEDEKQPNALIVIHSSNDSETTKYSLQSIREMSSFKNYEVVVVNTNEEEGKSEKLKEYVMNDDRFHFIDETPDDFASINNKTVREWAHDDTELILFCDDSVEMVNDALSRMVKTYMKNKKTCGTIGCRTHFEDNTVYQSGIAMMLGSDGKLYITKYGIGSYYNYRDNVVKGILSNSAEFMLVSKEHFDQVGGFSSEYETPYANTHFNIDLINMKKTNILDGTAVCIKHVHYEMEEETKENDMNKKLIPHIINSPNTYSHFLNISENDFKYLLAESMKQKQQEEQE